MGRGSPTEVPPMIKIMTTQTIVSSVLVSFNSFAYNSAREVQHALINIDE